MSIYCSKDHCIYPNIIEINKHTGEFQIIQIGQNWFKDIFGKEHLEIDPELIDRPLISTTGKIDIGSMSRKEIKSEVKHYKNIGYAVEFVDKLSNNLDRFTIDKNKGVNIIKYDGDDYYKYKYKVDLMNIDIEVFKNQNYIDMDVYNNSDVQYYLAFDKNNTMHVIEKYRITH